MLKKIQLSACIIPEAMSAVRHAPRPVSMRNEKYESHYDWKTLFYDVYRSGDYVVFQGPPLFNLKEKLGRYDYFSKKLGFLNFRNRIRGRNKAADIWIKTDENNINLQGELGSFQIQVQPDGNNVFADKRVLLTLSKNNDIRWIIDWITYHRNNHGTDAVLFYDNNSDKYSSDELQRGLSDAFPGLLILVISWPFKYGPQGGGTGGVGRKLAPWDSDFCQNGVFQHARFRFLQKARSVLNCDIDELVVSNLQKTIYECAEKSAFGVVHFSGVWISNATASQEPSETRCHARYFYFETDDKMKCPTKWCVVPRKCPIGLTWTAHNIGDKLSKVTFTAAYLYRHFKPISDNWKYGRWKEGALTVDSFFEDVGLRKAMAKAGLEPD